MTRLGNITRTLLVALTAAIAQAAPLTFTLDPAASEARFLIGENLLGRENTAVGTTSAVAGGVVIDGESVRFQAFVVDVSTLKTDDGRRDGQIRNNILQTGREGNGTVTFVPLIVTGLQLPLVSGGAQDIQLEGDLTIKGVTKTVVFDVTLEAVSETELKGTATALVRLEDFGIGVPRVPLVARVDEVVQLVLDFRLVAEE